MDVVCRNERDSPMIKLSTGFRDAICASAPIVPLMYGGTILLFDGTIPKTPDNPPAANLLAQVTTDGLPFVAGNVPTPSGLAIAWASPGYVIMKGNWVLKGTGITGIATWFRWCWRNPDPQTVTSYYPRLDGTVGDVFRMANPMITSTRVSPVEGFILSLPVGN